MPTKSEHTKNKFSNTAIKSLIGDALDMPKELMLNLPHLSIVGNEDIIIQNHQGLLAYASDLVRIKTNIGVLGIHGRDLVVSKITNEYIRLTGVFSSISYS